MCTNFDRFGTLYVVIKLDRSTDMKTASAVLVSAMMALVYALVLGIP